MVIFSSPLQAKRCLAQHVFVPHPPTPSTSTSTTEPTTTTTIVTTPGLDDNASASPSTTATEGESAARATKPGSHHHARRDTSAKSSRKHAGATLDLRGEQSAGLALLILASQSCFVWLEHAPLMLLTLLARTTDIADLACRHVPRVGCGWGLPCLCARLLHRQHHPGRNRHCPGGIRPFANRSGPRLVHRSAAVRVGPWQRHHYARANHHSTAARGPVHAMLGHDSLQVCRVGV